MANVDDGQKHALPGDQERRGGVSEYSKHGLGRMKARTDTLYMLEGRCSGMPGDEEGCKYGTCERRQKKERTDWKRGEKGGWV
jgi:hypothetical protein